MDQRLDTLVEDIYKVVSEGLEPSADFDKIIDHWFDEFRTVVRNRLDKTQQRARVASMSNLGHPDRKLWYHTHNFQQEQMPAHTHIKFMIGDITEISLLMLAELAGYKVTGCQDELDLNGVTGHRDAVIEGVTVDVKSASRYGFDKFYNKSLEENDPFGYIAQLSAYVQADPNTEDWGAFLAMNKETGRLCVSPFTSEELSDADKLTRHAVEVVNSETLPGRCYDPVPDGKAGNLKLSMECSYCLFKNECWQDANDGAGLRTFMYSNGPRHLVHVEKEPEVKEVW